MDGLSKKRVCLILLLVGGLLYLPLFTNPVNLLGRGNDLQEFFWPIISWTKRQILENHTLPLWNNLFFSGTPLLPDPQSLLFYPPNVLFLLLPGSAAFLVSFLIHTVLAGLGLYLLARALGLSGYGSLFASILYMTSPKLAGYLEAGHFGLVTSWAWLPFAILASLKIAKTPTALWAIFLGVSLAAVFFTHTITFLILFPVTLAVFFISILSTRNGITRWPQFATFFAGIAIMLGLTAVVLLPELNWLPQTTRFLLLKNPDVYPYWTSLSEFLRSIFIPWWGGKNNLWELDTEKWIALGVLPTLLATIGFWGSNNKFKFLIAAFSILVVLVSLNNISPLHHFLFSWNWYVLARVATRVWFVPVILTALMAGFGVDLLLKGKRRRSFLLLLTLGAVIELATLSWLRLARPIDENPKLAPREVYDFLKQDKEIFRVFCLNRCLSQKLVADYNLQTVEGYGTLQQKNYYNQFIQLSQVFWDRYTLALPPFQIYHFTDIQPYSPELADYNVKYVISSHKLGDRNLVAEASFGNYTIYRNTISKGRAYFIGGKNAPIPKYSPNKISIDTRAHIANEIVLSEVYSPGWKAYLDGKKSVPIHETKGSLRQIKIDEDTSFVDFVYEPPGYNAGRAITLTTLFVVIIILTSKSRRKLR